MDEFECICIVNCRLLDVMKLVVFEWFKKNYNKFYVKLLIVLKKNLKKLYF